MVEAVYPKFSQYIDTGGYVFFDLMEISNTIDGDSIVKTVGEYYREEQMPFIETMKNSVNFMCDNRYYFGKESQEKICENNTLILLGMRLLENRNAFLFESLSLKDENTTRVNIGKELGGSYYAKNTFSFKEQTIENIQNKYIVFLDDLNGKISDSSYVVNNAVYQFIYIPYIDNFNIYSEELIPNDDVKSHIWKHIFILIGCVFLSLLLCIFLLRYVFDVKAIIKMEK